MSELDYTTGKLFEQLFEQLKALQEEQKMQGEQIRVIGDMVYSLLEGSEEKPKKRKTKKKKAQEEDLDENDDFEDLTEEEKIEMEIDANQDIKNITK